jgi:hypothetical protein
MIRARTALSIAVASGLLAAPGLSRTMRLATAVLVFAVSAAVAEPASTPPLAEGIKFPNRFLTEWWRNIHRGARGFLDCSFTTKTCYRGIMNHRGCFIGAEVPDGDRDHVLRNIGWCRGRDGLFIDYVTGAVHDYEGDRFRYSLREDFAPKCVEQARSGEGPVLRACTK